MNEAVDAARADRRRSAATASPRPVLEPRQPGDPPPHHGRGDLARHRRQGGRARGRRGHRRHDHRRGRAAEGAQPRPARGGGRAEVLAGALRRHRPARTRSRASAPASCPPCCNREVVDEIIPVDDEDALETARRRVARARACSPASPCGAALWAAIEVGRAARVRGQADRGDPAGLGRALRVARRSSRRDRREPRPHGRPLPDELGADQARARAAARRATSCACGSTPASRSRACRARRARTGTR